MEPRKSSARYLSTLLGLLGVAMLVLGCGGEDQSLELDPGKADGPDDPDHALVEMSINANRPIKFEFLPGIAGFFYGTFNTNNAEDQMAIQIRTDDNYDADDNDDAAPPPVLGDFFGQSHRSKRRNYRRDS